MDAPALAEAEVAAQARARRDLQVCLCFFALAFGLCMPMIVLDKLPPHDVSERYAPMVRELAAGNWQAAFMPRIQPLLVLLSAPWARLGFHPFTALKLTSVLLFAAGVFPLYHLSRRVFDRNVASWTVMAYVFCAKLMQYAGDGLRETGKTTFLLLALAGLMAFFRGERRFRQALQIGAGAAFLALIRGETLVYSLAALAALLLMDSSVREHQQARRRWRFPRYAATAIAVFMLLISPWVFYICQATGYPVTDVRQAVVLYQLGRGLGLPMPKPPIVSFPP